MKKKFKLCVLGLALLLAGCSAPFRPPADNVYVRNPDCGFYQPIGVIMTLEGTRCNTAGLLTRNNLLHLRVSLNDFKDGEILTDAALEGLSLLLSSLRTASVNAVIRFAYDGFEGEADCEPPLSDILVHIGQLGTVLKEYPDVLTAIEAGMIGPWGEMHTSALANTAAFNAVVSAWLKSVPAPLPVLVRRPKFVADYLGVDLDNLGGTVILPQTDAYRLGVFNDGYLGSSTDLGTYKNREKEVAWLNERAAVTPFGGEVTVHGSEYNKIEYAANEMFSTHTSYLNELWNDKVIAAWKKTEYTHKAGPDQTYYGRTAYEYIRDHLGYRFTLKEYDLPKKAGKKLKLSVTVQSDGFGNLLKDKKCELVFKRDHTEYTAGLGLNPREWLCGGTYQNTVTADVSKMPSGTYEVFLRLREPEGAEPLYCVAFSNGLFDENTLGNRLGVVEIG